jgi:aspartyl-tRNA(Asn)/glutamyl-tRNA(Gln) amidotransferase subunit A
MAGNELEHLSIRDASALIANGELDPVALTEAVFRRIDETDDRLHSYVRLMRTSALLEARAAQERAVAGQLRGPLDGIPIAVKDLFDTARVVTAAGTDAYRERVPAQDATAVQRLREAGAVMLGKTNTHELAMGGTTNNIHFGATHNPWALDRVPGGSSGGSAAALTSGQALGALGTDTAGSIRLPADFCGITGHKPTYGLVGRGGVVPLSLTLDHAGPMARSAEDCAYLLEVLAGPDARDLDSAMRPGEDYASRLEGGIHGLRLGVIPSLVEGSSAAVRANFERSLQVLGSAGARIEEVEPLAGLADDWRGLVGSIVPVEGASYIEEVLARRPLAIGAPTRERLQMGLTLRGVDYTRALQVRKRIEQRCEAALAAGLDASCYPHRQWSRR